MSERPENISAFPFQSVTVGGEPNSPEYGMTLRDYFAAQVLPAVIQQCAGDTEARDGAEAYFARTAYELADAMLAERERQP